MSEDYSHDIVYTGKLSTDIIKYIFDNLANNNVVTYNGALLLRTLNAIIKDNQEYDFDAEKINGLMELYSAVHPVSKKWHRLREALESYNYITKINTDNPNEVAENTIILYRFMQQDNDFKPLLKQFYNF